MSDNIMLLYGRTAKFILTICVIVWLNESIDVLKGLSGEMQGGSKMGSNDAYLWTI